MLVAILRRRIASFGRSDISPLNSVTMEHAAICTALLYLTLMGFVISSPGRSVEKRPEGIMERLFGFYLDLTDFVDDSREDDVARKVAKNKTSTEEHRQTEPYPHGNKTLDMDGPKTTDFNKSDEYTPVTLNDLNVNNETELNSSIETTFTGNDTGISVNSTVKSSQRTIPSGVVVTETRTTADTAPRNVGELMKAKEQEHIETIKRRVLEKLRLDAPPKLRGPRPVLPFKHLQHEYMSDGSAKRRRTNPPFYARKKQVLVMGSDVTDECNNKKGTGCYHFDVEGKVNPNDIFAAEIWIYKLFHHYDSHMHTFTVSELRQDHQGRRRPKNMVNRLETPIKYGWLKIEVKRSVIRWVQKPRQNDGIAILCKSCIRKNPRTIFSFKNDTRPFLVITTNKGHNVRHARSAPRICTDTSTECCMKPLTINFHDIGWDSMIRPVSFQANYCYGSCEGQHQAHYNHTQMVQDHRWNQDEWNMMRQLTPCCAPISYSSLSIMYIENNDLQVDFVPNLVATACGCV